MARACLNRFVVLAGAVLIVATLGVMATNPVGFSGVSAQAQPTVASPIIQLPPPVPGLGYTTDDSGGVPSADSNLIPGTPVVPINPADATAVIAAPDNGGSLTATLGGSDIAVSSVGGSYEVDSPRRRGHRSPRR